MVDFWPLTHTLLVLIAISLVGLRVFQTYRGVVRYSSFIDLVHIACANSLSLSVAIVLYYLVPMPDYFAFFPPRMMLATFVMATAFMGGVRVMVKTLYELVSKEENTVRVLIYGALQGGVGLAKNIRSQRPCRYELKGFISHDSHYRHTLLLGKEVYSADEDLASIIDKEHIEAVLVSPLRTEDFRNEEILQNILINKGIKILMAQSAKEWNADDENFENVQLHEVSVEDLLPRDKIDVDMQAIGNLLEGKRILITGAAGSIGSEMVRQVAKFMPAEMVLIDQAETPMHDIRLMMEQDYPDVKAQTIVTSICKLERMEEIFAANRPEYVFHAAAYKHVPMMEDNPKEAVQNNIYGTRVIADLAVKYGTKKFVMISTDKAVNPTNVMGCSKRICEIYCQALNAWQSGASRAESGEKNRELSVLSRLSSVFSRESKVSGVGSQETTNLSSVNGTQFVTTRFGNVLGSNGSVIPLFREQIKNGGPVTVTHQDIIRYFMLIPEACKLVLEAGTMGKGGEIFVFDMGKPVRIMDLAKRMIQLSGAKNVEIKVTGLRDGEKLYEEVLSDKEKTMPTVHPKIMVAKVREYAYEDILKQEQELYKLSFSADNMAIVKKMKEIVPEFKSRHSVYEILDV